MISACPHIQAHSQEGAWSWSALRWASGNHCFCRLRKCASLRIFTGLNLVSAAPHFWPYSFAHREEWKSGIGICRWAPTSKMSREGRRGWREGGMEGMEGGSWELNGTLRDSHLQIPGTTLPLLRQWDRGCGGGIRPGHPRHGPLTSFGCVLLIANLWYPPERHYQFSKGLVYNKTYSPRKPPRMQWIMLWWLRGISGIL